MRMAEYSRNAAKKLKAVPFNQSKKKKITNYRNSGWSNIISITPTSVAESYAIVGAMYYLVGNVYQSQKMIGFGDQFINKSKNSSADKNIKDSLNALNKGIKKLNVCLFAHNIADKSTPLLYH